MIGALIAVLAAASLAAWAVLLFGRGGFWRADQRLDPDPRAKTTRTWQ